MTKLTLYDSATMSNFMYEQKIDLEKRLENICLEKNKIDEMLTLRVTAVRIGLLKNEFSDS